MFFNTYEYTESAEFCGQTCHVMKPQFVRFEESPHANVDCAMCHIGPGASFFIKSKIDGLRQVYAVMTDSYSRPIKSPVHDLRPARETCEQCHAPTMFKDNIIKITKHYDNDEANTPVQSTLILKMGGWQNEGGVSEGIHWHTSNPVYYIAADDVKCNLCHTVPIVGWGTDMLVEAPVIVGKIPDSRADFRWTIEYRFVQDAQKEGCYDCHGQQFCSNSACHNLSHPPDMLYSHAEEYQKRGGQVCYTCHQDVLCSRCHPGGIITNP